MAIFNINKSRSKIKEKEEEVAKFAKSAVAYRTLVEQIANNASAFCENEKHGDCTVPNIVAHRVSDPHFSKDATANANSSIETKIEQRTLNYTESIDLFISAATIAKGNGYESREIEGKFANYIIVNLTANSTVSAGNYINAFAKSMLKLNKNNTDLEKSAIEFFQRDINSNNLLTKTHLHNYWNQVDPVYDKIESDLFNLKDFNNGFFIDAAE